MDPLLFSLPELILSDMEYPDHPPGPPSSSSYFPPHHHHLAQESAHIHNLESDGPFGPSEPRLETPGPSNSNLRLDPDVMGPHVMGLPLVLVPHMLVPVGGPLCCSPCSGPPPLLLLPEVRHTWCSCHRPHGRDPDSRGTTSEGQRAEPEGQRSRGYGKEEEQNIDNLRGTPVPPGCFPSFVDESLNFEEFARTVNSLGLKAESMLSAEFLDSLLLAGPEPVDLLLLGERETEAESRDPPPSPDPLDLLSHKELLLEILAVTQQQLADLSAAESDGATPGTEETAPATLSVEEPSPWKPDPPGSESHASPDQDGGNAPPTEGGTVGPPVLASSRRPEASASPLDHDGRLYPDYMASQWLRGGGEGVTAREEEEEEEEEEEASDEAVEDGRERRLFKERCREGRGRAPRTANGSSEVGEKGAEPAGGGETGTGSEPSAKVPREEPTPPPAVGAGGEEAEHVRDGGAPGAKTREEEAGRATQRSGNGTESPSKRGRGRGGGEEAAGGGGSEAPVRDWSPPSTRSGAKTRSSAPLSTKYKDFLSKKKKNRKPARRERL